MLENSSVGLLLNEACITLEWLRARDCEFYYASYLEVAEAFFMLHDDDTFKQPRRQ